MREKDGARHIMIKEENDFPPAKAVNMTTPLSVH